MVRISYRSCKGQNDNIDNLEDSIYDEDEGEEAESSSTDSEADASIALPTSSQVEQAVGKQARGKLLNPSLSSGRSRPAFGVLPNIENKFSKRALKEMAASILSAAINISISSISLRA